MLKIFLSSHGRMASGMKSSLDILLGSSKNITVYDAYVDSGSVQEELDEFYLNVDKEDEILLLSDLYGGSVNQVMFTYLQKAKTRLVAGVNLALVLELANKDWITDEELEEVVNQSRLMMTIIKDVEINSEEDFF